MTKCEHCFHEFHGTVPGFKWHVHIDGGICCQCKCIVPSKNLKDVVLTKDHPERVNVFLDRLRSAGK